MEKFSIDESGYTGFDLLDPPQPYQGATAISINDDEAARLIKEHFPKLQAPELKYSSLARRESNRPRLLALQRDILSSTKAITYVCDKRYLLLLMFVDYAVEPFYYDKGFDLYEDGGNLSMASMLYFAGHELLGQIEFAALLAAFQRAMKSKTAEAMRDLVSAARRTRWDRIPEALGPLVHAHPDCLDAIRHKEVSTDAAFVVLQSLITRLEVMTSADYRIEHDRSKNLLRYGEMISKLIAHDVNIEFRASEIAALKFPLKLKEVVQVDSKNSPAVQLCDVMIGAAIEAAKTLRDPRSNSMEVLRLYKDDQIIHLLPTTDFEEVKRDHKGTQASKFIDYFAKNFS
ncbi:DUF3800 domain-containing protein [Cupriavidus sp. AcVe19-6a]|uniref:DUF3800 domain-containing protein n=1 Tax=Cupriavidus sp. AcVe19-6a TaxID=2821358 RepID=UPI001AE865C9|nr:DUF3800 domain-containing protein [Cupriavidus sp. AcVe19-6a]MBP0634875.1 DUF3800 domain-containing protein [Cupriavidus sp. AcVe19-6a]